MGRRQHDPHSPDFQKFLTPTEFGRRFGAPEEDIQKVIEYLQKYGVKVTKLWSGRQSISIDGTVSQLEAAFKVRIKGYDLPGNELEEGDLPTFHAPDRPASLPRNIASCILGIFGMSSQMRVHSKRLQTEPDDIFSKSLLFPDAFPIPPEGFLPSDMSNLYNVGPLQILVGNGGMDQRIGIVSYAKLNDANILEWCSQFRISDPITSNPPRLLHRASTKWPPKTDPGQERETVLDIETILGQAPAVTVVLYEQGNDGNGPLSIFSQIAQDNIPIISDSHGTGEVNDPAWVQARNDHLKQMYNQGQAYYAASGDTGAYNERFPYGISAVFPASSQYVTAVGATALTGMSSNGSFLETAMYFSQLPNLWGSGGGMSVLFPRPFWQIGPGVDIPGISNGMRQVPDVSSLGDQFNPGIALWYNHQWWQSGGTSAAAPFWAACHLLINQALGMKLANPGFRTASLNPYLYDLARIFPSTIPNDDGNIVHYIFNDITAGTNGAYNCAPAYDLVTGLGSADMYKLFLDIGQTYYTQADVDLVPFTPVDNGKFGKNVYPLQIHPLPYDVTEPFSFNNGTYYSISVGIQNDGIADAEPSTYTIQIDGVDHVFQTQLTDGTPFPIPGSNTWAYFSSLNAYMTSFTSGTHTLKLTVNSDNKIKESNANNNVYTRTITVMDNTTPTVSAVSLNPSILIGGSQNSTGKVILSSPETANVIVTLSSSDTTVATVPASVTVPAGSISASFTITSLNVATSKQTDIKAVSNGVSKLSTLTVMPLGVNFMTLAPGSVTGGTQTATGKVILNGKTKSPVTVNLTSSNTSAATVPATVTIAAGQDSATFIVSTSVVARAQSVSITSDYNGFSLHVTLTVSPPQILTSLILNPDHVYGVYQESTGTVSLSSPAVDPVNVLVYSLDGYAITPGLVTIPAGAMSADFQIETRAVDEVRTAGILAVYNGVFTGANLTINPLGVDSVNLNPDTVRGNNTSIGTVTLNGTPDTDVTVNLSSSNTGVATVPATVVVLAGSLSATFDVTTFDAPLTQTSLISATLNNVPKSAVMTVYPLLPLFAPASVTLAPSLVLGGVTNSVATVTLTATVAFPVTVTLSSSDTSAATVPSSITFSGLSAAFSVTSLAVTSTKTPLISASLNGVTKSATLTVAPPVSLSALTLTPPVLISGQSGIGTISLVGTAVSAVTVTLTNSNPAAASLPTTVTIPSGSSSAAFIINANSVVTTQTSTITASLAGVSTSAQLTVNPPPAQPVPIGISFNPSTVVGGQQSSTSTVSLSSTPTSATTVTLSSSDTTAATVPASVTVAAGSATATFTVTSLNVGAVKTPSITATANGGSVSNSITVNPNPTLSSLTITPNSVIGGIPNLYPVTATVSMNYPPASDVIIWMASNSNLARTQPNVIILAGTTSTTFPITAYLNSNSYSLNVTFYASMNSSFNPSITADLTLLPTPSFPLLSNCFLNSSPLVGGQENGTCQVGINKVAPAGGITVTLTSSDPTVLTLPATITIPQGSASLQFPATTLAVSSTKTVFYRAALNGVQLNSNVISIVPVPDYSFSVSPTSVISSINGTATITLQTTINKDTTVNVTSDNPNLTVPNPNSTIIAGATSTNIFWTVIPVTTAQTATLTATVYGRKKTAIVTLQPVSVLTNLSISPASIIGSIESSTSTVTVNIPTSMYTTVTLTTDDPNLIFLPSLSVQPGDTSATFTISHTAVSSLTIAHITATCNGVSQTATITILPLPTLTSIILSPASVVGGLQTSTATVTLSAAYPNGTLIDLSSSDKTSANSACVDFYQSRKLDRYFHCYQ